MWIFLARSCLSGKNWARITATVLLAISTIETIAGVAAPEAGLVKIWAALLWLVGLAAVILLWRRSSSGFFRATP